MENSENNNPNKFEVKVYNLDVSQPIDISKATSLIGGNKKLYINMLSKIEVMSLSSQLNQIADAINNKDWPKMKMAAHTLKSTSGYVGAGKLHYSCYYVQSTWVAQDFVGMVNFYPLVVEASIEFKRFVRRYLAEYNGK